MQAIFDFGESRDICWVRDRLRRHFGHLGVATRRTPVGQLVKSMLGSRTRDEISLAAYMRLVDAYDEWSALACAPPDDIETIIAQVTFPEVKAPQIADTLRIIEADCPDFDLGFLSHMPVPEGLKWLERLPGVGRKVSASALNFSTLNMPSFVIDTHILRILRRFGFVRSRADTETAYDSIMAMTPEWSADEFIEFHCLLKRLGQTVCQSDRGHCRECPIQERCRAVDVLLSAD